MARIISIKFYYVEVFHIHLLVFTGAIVELCGASVSKSTQLLGYPLRNKLACSSCPSWLYFS